MERKEAIEIVRKLYNESLFLKKDKEAMVTLIPELAESEDERTRKELLLDIPKVFPHDKAFRYIAYLEKQGEKKHQYNSRPRYVGEGELLGKKATKIEPKFKVGDVIRQKGTAATYTIIKVTDTTYYTKGWSCSIERCEKDYELVEPKYAEIVKPKFKDGDWVVYQNETFQVRSLSNGSLILQGEKYQTYFIAELCRPWTIIQDAKAGDVLATEDAVFIFKHIDKTGLSLCKSYCEVIGNSELGFGFDFSINDVYPATKEQRDTLMKAMTDAGYTFDFEKKELKDIQKPAEWSPEDEIMQKAALEILMASPKLVASTILKESVIDWLNSLKGRVQPQPKQEWSDEDENRVDQICEDLKCGLINFYAGKNVKGLHFDEIIESNIVWLKELEERIAMQTKQERSEEDEKLINSVIELIDNGALDRDEKDDYIERLKSLKPQSHWKPSEEQMAQLSNASNGRFYNCETLLELLEDLKKLKE